MKKGLLAGVLALQLLFAGCGAPGETKPEKEAGKTEETVTVFAAKSLNKVMDELSAVYEEEHPGVEIVGNYDSSGTLMLQIEQGAECDIFFSAAPEQMDELENAGYVVEGTRHDVVNNRVCVVTYPGSGTKVTGLADLGKADSIALADVSVPVGSYTREALVRAGVLTAAGESAVLTTQEISDQLGGVTINECANVGVAAAAVAEGANEVGTVYYSDTFGYGDKLEILEIVSNDLTGDVIYPAAQIREGEAAADFLEFIISDEAQAIFEKYCFYANAEK